MHYIMWSTAMFISCILWTLLFVFLVYATGVLFLQLNFHQFFLALLLWTLSNIAVVVFAALA